MAEQEIKVKGTFTVRNDKSLIVGEALQTTDGNEYFFKFHDQPITRHCQQIQNIAKMANIQRTKKSHVDMSDAMRALCSDEQSFSTLHNRWKSVHVANQKRNGNRQKTKN